MIVWPSKRGIVFLLLQKSVYDAYPNLRAGNSHRLRTLILAVVACNLKKAWRLRNINNFGQLGMNFPDKHYYLAGNCRLTPKFDLWTLFITS
jgi:hypothetical protein